MPTQYQPEYREHDLEVAAQLAAQTVQINSLQEQVTQGFELLTAKLDDYAPRLTRVEDQLQATRDTKRAWGKWAMGIAAAIVGTAASAFVLIHLGLK